MKFKRKQLVRHLKTGGIYRIVHAPDHCRIEATNEPAYAYRLVEHNGANWRDMGEPLWVRPQAEMEDGRFELVDRPAADIDGDGVPQTPTSQL